MAIKKELKEFKASGEDSSTMDPVSTGNTTRPKDNNSVRMAKADEVKKVTPGQNGAEPDMIETKPKSANTKRHADKAANGEKMSKLKEMVAVLAAMSNEDLDELHGEMVSENSKEASVVEVVREDFEALFAEDDLSEDFKKKFFTLVEAAVITKVLEETSTIQDSYDSKLEEATEALKEEINDKVDGYLHNMSETWMEENEVALESNMRTEIAESFLEGLKALYEAHDIEVPDSKVDVLEDLTSQIAELEEALNKAIDDNIELTSVVEGFENGDIISEMSDELTESQKDKFNTLAENIEYGSKEEYVEKLEIIKESLTGAKTKSSDNSAKDLNEEFESEEEVNKEISDQMAAYVKAVSDNIHS